MVKLSESLDMRDMVPMCQAVMPIAQFALGFTTVLVGWLVNWATDVVRC